MKFIRIPLDPKSPKAMWDKAETARHLLMRTFNEIMTGPNPLTPEECARMAAKRPEYAFMAAFGPKEGPTRDHVLQVQGPR
jgi:hypothetical protein